MLLFNLLGLLGHEVVHIPLPGPVLGLILFTLCLFLGIVRLQWVEQTASLLLRHMLLFFAPFIVGVIPYFPRLRSEWPAIVLSLVISTIVVMLVTGFSATALIRPKKHAQHKEPIQS